MWPARDYQDVPCRLQAEKFSHLWSTHMTFVRTQKSTALMKKCLK